MRSCFEREVHTMAGQNECRLWPLGVHVKRFHDDLIVQVVGGQRKGGIWNLRVGRGQNGSGYGGVLEDGKFGIGHIRFFVRWRIIMVRVSTWNRNEEVILELSSSALRIKLNGEPLDGGRELHS